MKNKAKLRVAVNGDGVTGKRVADAGALQPDMQVAGIADVASDWRIAVAIKRGFAIFAATDTAGNAMRASGLPVTRYPSDLLAIDDVVVDATPKAVATAKIAAYRSAGPKFIVQGGGAGLGAINIVKEWMQDIGHPRADLYEVAVWEDMLTVQGDELPYAYLVENQAIVVPETIDAIRAICGLQTDPSTSNRMTNAALGIGSLHPPGDAL